MTATRGKVPNDVPAGEAPAGDVLVAAITARALARSARRGGWRPLVADFFGDLDTRAAAAAHVRVAGSFARGFGEAELMTALERLAAGRAPAGIVCGTGFEDRPQLLSRIAGRWPLWGNGAGTVSRVKDPQAFAATCEGLGVPSPEISLTPPRGGAFLAKRRGGSGGSHVAEDAAANVGPGSYWQARVPGRSVSALLLGDGDGTTVLGFSEQWASPAPGRPFRWGGAVRPAAVSDGLAARLGQAAAAVAAAFALTGLNSADFMVDGDDFRLVEVNPRPGATLDIFEPADGRSLFALHVAACTGSRAAAAPWLDGAAASAVAWAAHALTVPADLAWPPWCADLPAGGLAIGAGDPLCTVHASAATAAAAQALTGERLQQIAALARTWAREDG